MQVPHPPPVPPSAPALHTCTKTAALTKLAAPPELCTHIPSALPAFPHPCLPTPNAWSESNTRSTVLLWLWTRLQESYSTIDNSFATLPTMRTGISHLLTSLVNSPTVLAGVLKAPIQSGLSIKKSFPGTDSRMLHMGNVSAPSDPKRKIPIALASLWVATVSITLAWLPLLPLKC
jgi:hypothetical protein